MSYGAIVSAVVAAGSAAYSSSQQKKAAEKAANVSSEEFKAVIDYAKKNPEAFGSKPDEWNSLDYAPLFQTDPGYANLAAQVIAGNQGNLDASTQLSRDTNAYATEDARTRMNQWYPGFQDAFSQQQQNTSNLLAGRLPWEDIMGIAARRTEANSLLGGAGNSQQVAADLGLTRLSLMQQGERSLNANADLVGRIDPFARRIMPQSMFVDTGQAISTAATENWQDYQAAAAERDAAFAYEMMADPYHQGMLNLYAGAAGINTAGAQQSAAANIMAAQQQGQSMQQLGQIAGQLATAYFGGQQSSGGYGSGGAWGTDYSDPSTQSGAQIRNMSDRPSTT